MLNADIRFQNKVATLKIKWFTHELMDQYLSVSLTFGKWHVINVKTGIYFIAFTSGFDVDFHK